jgi:outer membrane protein OmpA-like peptidoglycan-associated protein
MDDPFATGNPDVEPSEPTPPEAPPQAKPPAEPAPAPTPAASAEASATPAGAAAAGAAAAPATAPDDEDDVEIRQRERLELRKLQPGLHPSTAMFRTRYAGSGPEGTFRFGFLTSYFSDKAFLCPQCSDAEGGPGSTPDDVRRVGAHLQISATPWSFFEGYLGVHSTATSNTRGDPELLQVLGDSTWGIKVFTPREPDKAFSIGGAAEMLLLNGTGGVGVENTSFALRLLTTLDFANRTEPKRRTPFRFNFNLSYVFDNSGKLVEPIEAERERPITRIERYGLNINRVDYFTPALGFEGVFGTIRPYAEWSIDVPANRQDYRCAPSQVFASDVCLERHITFESAPSRFTLGTRAFLFLDGLAFNAALDLGTGGTMPPFWEEVQPESPWMFHFGVSYAADTEPVVRTRKIPAPVAPPPIEKPKLTISGQVQDQESGAPVANAIVRYTGRPITGMVTDESGRFTTGPLEPGSYAFAVTAPDYEDGACTVEVAAPPPPAPAPAPPPKTTPDGKPLEPAPAATASATPPAPAPADKVTELKCQLKAKPQLGAAVVYAVDPEGAGVPYAKITAIDALGRPLTLDADDQGGVAFGNVPPGPLTLVVEAEGYLRATQKLEIEAKSEARADVPVFPKPKRSNLTVTAKEIQLKRPIEFAPGTAELLPASRAIVDELADLLRSSPDVGPIEIEAHTDDSSPADIALQLTTQRANAVRDALIANGVAATRALAKGLGSTEPKVKNTTDANRQKNNRVVIKIGQATVMPE